MEKIFYVPIIFVILASVCYVGPGWLIGILTRGSKDETVVVELRIRLRKTAWIFLATAVIQALIGFSVRPENSVSIEDIHLDKMGLTPVVLEGRPLQK